MGYKDAENFLDLWGCMGTCVVEESVAIVLGVGAKMVGVFLWFVSYSRYEHRNGETYKSNIEGMFR